MNTRVSARDISLLLTTTSILLAFAAIQLGHRLNYLEHLPMFNAMAAGMLALVVAGLVFAAVTLVRARGMGGSLWFAASLATVVLGMLLLVDLVQSPRDLRQHERLWEHTMNADNRFEQVRAAIEQIGPTDHVCATLRVRLPLSSKSVAGTEN